MRGSPPAKRTAGKLRYGRRVNIEHRTKNIKRRTSNFEHRTSSTHKEGKQRTEDRGRRAEEEHRTENVEHPTLNIQRSIRLRRASRERPNRIRRASREQRTGDKGEKINAARLRFQLPGFVKELRRGKRRGLRCATRGGRDLGENAGLGGKQGTIRPVDCLNLMQR